MTAPCELSTVPEGATTQEFSAVLVENNGCSLLNALKLKALQFWARGISK